MDVLAHCDALDVATRRMVNLKSMLTDHSHAVASTRIRHSSHQVHHLRQLWIAVLNLHNPHLSLKLAL